MLVGHAAPHTAGFFGRRYPRAMRPDRHDGHRSGYVLASTAARPKYTTWGRAHPLTPHYAVKAGGEYLPVHPQPGGIGYRHWLGLVLQSPDGLRLPAEAIATWRRDRMRDAGRDQGRLIAAGYDMDSMKARFFVESEMPLPGAADPTGQLRLDELATRLVRAADLVANLLRDAVRAALFSPGAAVKPDAELLSSVR
jgi:CRISPR system Cascade subunit CasA